MEKQEMETEEENWNENSCTVVSNHWTGLTQTPSFSAGQKLNMLIQPIAPEPGQASCLKSVEVKGHMHI